MDIAALATELTTDPEGIGYSGMSNQEAADALNVANRPAARETLSGADIYNCIEPSEFTALTDAQKQIVRDVFGLGDSIDVRAGTNTRAALLAIFNGGSTTRANLIAKAQTTIPRWQEINLGSPVGDGHVASVRQA